MKELLYACAVMSLLNLNFLYSSETIQEEDFTPCCPPTVSLNEESSEFLSPDIFKTDHYDLDDHAENLLIKLKSGQYKDRRTRVVNPSKFPYKAQVHFKTTFHTGKGEIGSGTFIDDYIILTAAHVVFSHKKKGIYKEIACFIDERNLRSAGRVRGVKLPMEYVNNKEAWESDYALVFLERPIGRETGFLGLINLSNEYLSRYPITIAGYPADKIKIEKGRPSLWEMSGPIHQITPRSLHYDIDTVKGQSGSAIWLHLKDKGYFIAGVHAYGNNKDKGHSLNRGPRIEGTVFKKLRGWVDDFKKPGFEFDNKELTKVSLSLTIKGGRSTNESGELEENKDLPVDLLERARAGDGKANYEIGLLYHAGKKIDKNTDQALLWFTLALPLLTESAEQGDVEAQHKLGVMYNLGRAATKDTEEARKWFLKAASQGYPNSQYNLGALYEKEKDMKMALKWYKKACKSGFAEAQYRLGMLYKSGVKSVLNKDKIKAFELWKRAAEQGHKEALAIVNYNAS